MMGSPAAGETKQKKSAAESGNGGKKGKGSHRCVLLSLFTIDAALADEGHRRRPSPTISSAIALLNRGGGINPSVLLALSVAAMFASSSLPLQWSLDSIVLNPRVEFRSILFTALLTFLVLIIGQSQFVLAHR